MVKEDCPTCRLVVPLLGQLAEGETGLTVYSQDDLAAIAHGALADILQALTS